MSVYRHLNIHSLTVSECWLSPDFPQSELVSNDCHLTVHSQTVREAPKINAALIWEFCEPGLTYPLPPQDFWNFWGTFTLTHFFSRIFWGTFLYPNSLKTRGKSAAPPLFLHKICILLVDKGAPNFWISSKPSPPHLWKIPKLKLHFFFWGGGVPLGDD